MCSPSDNVRQAFHAGLAAIAITDHDTIAGIEEATTEGARLGIEVVPGVEISTVESGVDVHILGYYINYKDTELLDRLEKLRGSRNVRNAMIVDKLKVLGIPITMDDVIQSSANKKTKNQSIGRPHIADVLLKLGVVSSMKEAFDLYLGQGASAYVTTPRLQPAEAITLIRKAGGKAVLAHPGIYRNPAIVKDVIEHGLDGIEVYHSDHSQEDELFYAELATRNGLIITAGSDFHGERNGVIFHGGIGSKLIDAKVLDELKSKRRCE